MENTAPVRALNRRSTQLLQLGFIVLAVGVFLAIVGAVISTILLIPRTHPLFGLYSFAGGALIFIGLIGIIGGIALAVRALTRRRENDLAALTGDFLGRAFDGRYTFIRNINRPGLGYIDAVLIGPPGALVFRIIDNVGSFANEAANWMIYRNGDWVPFRFSPTKEAVDDVQHLRQYLAKHNMAEVPVFGVVVLTQDPSRITVADRQGVVPVSHLVNLPEDLRRDYLSKEDRIHQNAVTAIRRLLLEG